jgi:DNA-binding XRE family transcriptional regulator
MKKRIDINDYIEDRLSFLVLLKSVRKALNMSQLEVAAWVGITRETYCLYENGRAFPRNIDRFCDSIRALIKENITARKKRRRKLF